jgi:SPP1 gp7 family putative phage head morphogenesis protein
MLDNKKLYKDIEIDKETLDNNIIWLDTYKKNVRIDQDEDRYDVDENVVNLFKDLLKMRRREMKPKQRERTQNQTISTVVLYPFAQERQYQKYLFDLMDVYSNIAIPEIRENLPRWNREINQDSTRQDDFNDEFQRLVSELERTQFNMFNEDGNGVEDDKGNTFNNALITGFLLRLGLDISEFNKKQVNKGFTKILGQPFLPAEPFLDNVLESWKNNNFRLIKSLSDEYIKKTNTIVSEGIANGDSSKNIMKDLLKMDKNMTQSRARLIARDQVGKLNGQLTKRRNQEAGLNLYKWLTARDERVRTTHRPLHNKICRWDDDTIYAENEKAAREGAWRSRTTAGMYIGTPGSDIQCRCTSVAVVSELNAEVDEELEREEAVA